MQLPVGTALVVPGGLGCVDLGVISSSSTDCGVPTFKTASKALGATTLAVKPVVRVTWSTYDLVSRYQLVEQTGQLDVVDAAISSTSSGQSFGWQSHDEDKRSPEVVQARQYMTVEGGAWREASTDHRSR